MIANKNIIDEIIRECAVELFSQQGTELASGAESLDPHDYVAVIGFYGDSMRGALGIGLDRAIVAQILESAGAASSARGMLEDWVGEAANQLLGRVKNRLLGYGVTLGLALPMVLRGVEVHLVKATSEIWQYRFACAQGGMTIWFDARIDDGIVLERQSGPDQMVASEGALTLF